MKPKIVKKLLLSEINRIATNSKEYCTNPKTDFTRNRKLPLKRLLQCIIGMGGGNLSNELLDFYQYSTDAASSSAFVQQRHKIKKAKLLKKYLRVFLIN